MCVCDVLCGSVFNMYVFVCESLLFVAVCICMWEGVCVFLCHFSVYVLVGLYVCACVSLCVCLWLMIHIQSDVFCNKDAFRKKNINSTALVDL